MPGFPKLLRFQEHHDKILKKLLSRLFKNLVSPSLKRFKHFEQFKWSEAMFTVHEHSFKSTRFHSCIETDTVSSCEVLTQNLLRHFQVFSLHFV